MGFVSYSAGLSDSWMHRCSQFPLRPRMWRQSLSYANTQRALMIPCHLFDWISCIYFSKAFTACRRKKQTCLQSCYIFNNNNSFMYFFFLLMEVLYYFSKRAKIFKAWFIFCNEPQINLKCPKSKIKAYVSSATRVCDRQHQDPHLDCDWLFLFSNGRRQENYIFPQIICPIPYCRETAKTHFLECVQQLQ